MSANRMAKILGERKARGERSLITYYPLCDPIITDPVTTALAFFDAGADVLEMGLPCANPYLDGATVSASMARAIKAHKIEDAFDEVAAIRAAKPDALLQIMTYWSIIETMGVNTFVERARSCGADAINAPDAPEIGKGILCDALSEQKMLFIEFVPYHMSVSKLNEYRQHDEGYLFLQAVDGATGARNRIDPHVGETIQLLRKEGFTANLCPGFGISTPEHIRDYIELGADGVIVGSAVLRELEMGNVLSFIGELKSALATRDLS